MQGYPRLFHEQKYEAIKAELLKYRLDPFIRDKESEDGPNKGLIFPFARGLRFSALLVYTIREALSDTDLQVNWGQLIDDDGFACSGECDIIVHKKGHVAKWNGNDSGNHIMDFRFIEKDKALAVISCKSYITKNTIERLYCKNMLAFVSKVWLFAECCGPDSVELIREESREIGYEHFWHLYTWSRDTGNTVDDVAGWMHFINTAKSLKNYI